jgi:hypothetical protein
MIPAGGNAMSRHSSRHRSRSMPVPAPAAGAAAGRSGMTGLRRACCAGLVEVLEELQVGNARAPGWSWRDIARRLGVTKQAVHYKHTLRLRRR